MILRRAILLSSLLWLPAGLTHASTFVVRDSIGDSSASTDEMPGASAFHDGADWGTPGLVVNVPADGELNEARFVIFASAGLGPVFFPENSLANVYGYPMEFHLWTDGVLGGADSFDENPHGSPHPATEHGFYQVNYINRREFITLEPFGHTGPPSNTHAFTTFLLTIDLSSFDIMLHGGSEYVMSVIQDGSNFINNDGGGLFRIVASKHTGFEDLFRAFNFTTSPGYVQSQLGSVFQQYAGAFTIAPLAEGDYDFDGVVDGTDFLAWQRVFRSADSMADGNDDGVVDGDDLQIWINNFGNAASAHNSAAVAPEPSSIMLLLSLPALVRRRGRCRFGELCSSVSSSRAWVPFFGPSN